MRKGNIIVKDKDGNTFCINKSDKKFIDKTYVGIAKDMISVYNDNGEVIKINRNDDDYKNGKRYHRSNFMKHKLIKGGADPNKSESEILKELGYLKIWNSGNLKYIWT